MESQLKHIWDDLTVKLTKTPKGLIGVGWCEICLS